MEASFVSQIKDSSCTDVQQSINPTWHLQWRNGTHSLLGPWLIGSDKLSVIIFKELEAISCKGWGSCGVLSSHVSAGVPYHLCPDDCQAIPPYKWTQLMGTEPHWWSFIFHSWWAAILVAELRGHLTCLMGFYVKAPFKIPVSSLI